jgi:5-methylcytosine-specific restriction enzyme subunit McrC
MREWDTLTVKNVTPSSADLALTRVLAEQNESMLRVEWLYDRSARITSRSWVGVVRFDGFEVRVEPKLVGGNLGILRMLDYTRGLDSIQRLPTMQDLEDEGASLIDLVCWLLADQCDYILRHGLLSDYVTREETLLNFRGQLRIYEQIRRHYGQVSELECRYDEYESDILENRILAVALRRARRVCVNTRVRAMLGRVEPLFSEVCPAEDIDVTAARDELTYHRRNQHYRDGHHWAFLLLGGKAIKDVYSAGDAGAFAFMFDMNRLFEEFVETILREALRSTMYRLASQSRTRSIVVDEKGRNYSTVIPDLLIRTGSRATERVLPVDSKYKLYDDQRVVAGDIYQTFLYAYAFAPPGSFPTAGVVFPAAAESRGFSLGVQNTQGTRAARIKGFGLDIQVALRRIALGEAASPELVGDLLELMEPPEESADTLGGQPVLVLTA